MRRLLVLLLIGLCLTGGEARAQLIGNPAGCILAGCSFSGPVNLSNGGSMGGTFTGTPTFSGATIFSSGLTTGGGGALAANFTNLGRGNTYTPAGSTIDTTKIGLFNNNNCTNGTSSAAELPCMLYSTGTLGTTTPNTVIDGANFSYNVGGATAAAGQWSGVSVTMNDSAATNDKTAGSPGAWVALQVSRRASKNQGGTGLTPTTAFGQNWGMDIVATLASGATDMALNNGLEVDLSQQSGSSVVRSAGLQIAHTSNHAVQGSMWDYGMLFAQVPSSAPFLTMVGFAGALSPHPPVDSTGTLISYQIAQDITAPANKGLDYNDATFTTCSLCMPGFVVGGSGAALGTTRIGSLYVTPSSAGESIDAIGSVGTGTPSINTGGSGYTDGGHNIVFDANGGVYDVASTSGVVTSINSVIAQPVFSGLSPPSTLATTTRPPSVGTGLILAPTWDSTRTAIKLNPSAGGETIVGSGSNVSALNITKGFFHFPFTNATSGSGGIPTGTPGNISGNACIFNDVTFTLNCYSASAGAWKHITFSAGAG